MSEENNTAEMLAAGAALATAKIVSAGGVIPYVIVPQNYKVELMERLLPLPARKRGSLSFTQAGSLCEYVKKHGKEGSTVFYASVDCDTGRCVVVATIDDHGAEAPDWREHTASYAPKPSIEWRRWMGEDRKPMSQSEFAVWVEDNLGDIATIEGMPTGTEMLGMALAFEANAERRFKQKINLQSSGVHLEFVDDEEKDTRTKMQVFERFTLGLPVFEGSINAYPLEARLRYRATDGKVVFWYELIRADKVFRRAVDDQLESIQSDTGFLLLYGSAGTEKR